MIFRFVRPSKVNEWLKNNFPSSLIGTAGDNWKKYLQDHGGTGSTFHDLEQSYLNSGGRTIFDRWSTFLSTTIYTGNVFLDNIRKYFDSIVNVDPPTESTTEVPVFFFIIPQ
jgi:hypothetical protein